MEHMSQNQTLIEIQFLHWINSLDTKILKLRLDGTRDAKLDFNKILIWNLIRFSHSFTYYYIDRLVERILFKLVSNLYLYLYYY